MRSLEWGPNPMIGALVRKEKSAHRHTQKEDAHVRMETELGVRPPQTRVCGALLATTRSWERQEGFFPGASRGSKALVTP